MANISSFLLTNAIMNINNAIEQISKRHNYSPEAIEKLRGINQELTTIREKYRKKDKKEEKAEM